MRHAKMPLFHGTDSTAELWVGCRNCTQRAPLGLNTLVERPRDSSARFVAGPHSLQRLTR